TSTVTGNTSVGGLAGRNYGGGSSIIASYSTGMVKGEDYVGGLVGSNWPGYWGDEGSTTTSFWDVETSGQSSSEGGTGLTTVEMQTAGTFLDVGWDFVDETENGTEDIWWILEGQDYPGLWWELIEENSVVIPEN
ncbi:MAG: GLUG motif-containing protein, partial [Planctomycetota bacterium]